MRKGLLVVTLVAVGAVALAVTGARVAWTHVSAPYRGYAGSEQFVIIPPGAGARDIGARLFEARVIDDQRLFRGALWWTGKARTLKAGEYRFDRPLSVLDVIDRLARGDVYVHRITFPEGLTIAAMARIYEAHAFGPAQDFVEAAKGVELIRDLDPDAQDLEGYLFPETYAIPRGTPAARLVEAMVQRFLAVYDESMRARAEAQGLDTREVVTLASLVEKETGRADERAMVAAVYRNRLKIGMAMQADPTVVYALEKAGRYDGNIRREDLNLNSPYNTYRNAGLPPGPIAAPGRASIEAVLAPAPIRALYFVSRNDGSHAFADTLVQHNANVRRFQVEFFRARRAR